MKLSIFAFLLPVALWLGIAPVACASGWTLTSSTAGNPTRLSYDGLAEKGVHYAFMCEPDGVSIIESGVTALMDPGTGQKVGDNPGSAMLEGAAVMALFTDRTQPKFVSATATPNDVRGWDLKVKLPLNDPALRALPKAKATSLMTTGWTALVELGADDRRVIASFLAECAAR